MPLTDGMKTADNENTKPSVPEQQLDSALGEIDRILRRMLALAELSASDLPVDRPLLQETLEHLSSELDRAADKIRPEHPDTPSR